MPAICAVLFALALGAAPSTSVRQWRPAHISSEQFESHPAFDPRNGDLYFVRSSPQFKGWRLTAAWDDRRPRARHSIDSLSYQPKPTDSPSR
jgi:hypothetical protein